MLVVRSKWEHFFFKHNCIVIIIIPIYLLTFFSEQSKSLSAKPSTPATPTSGKGRGRPKGSTNSTPVRSRATPAEKKTVSKKSTAEKKSTLKATKNGGKNGTPAAKVAKTVVNKAAASKTDSTVSTPVKEKKPRMSKKKKEELAKEQEKKIEERKKILGEWDDEEDGEAEVEEKKKIKEIIGENSDESDVDSEQEAYWQVR